MSDLRLPVLLLVTALCACTKPVPEPAGTASGGAKATAAAAGVLLYNAYASSSLAVDGSAGVPGKVFAPGDKVYVGVVLHGNAPASKVKVEWSRDAAVLGQAVVDVPVAGASVGTVELTREGPLLPGNYKALVYLDGTPSWEVAFTVGQGGGR